MRHCEGFQKTFKNKETENVNEMFTSRQLHQDATVRRPFREWLQGAADGLVEIQLISDISCSSTQPPTTPWRWGRSQSMKRQRNVTSWHGCLFHKVLFISVAENASREKKKFWLQTYVYSQSLYLLTDAQERCFTRALKFTLKQLLHVSVQSPSSGSALFELAKVIVIKIIS